MACLAILTLVKTGELQVYIFHLSHVCPKLGVKESSSLHFSLSVLFFFFLVGICFTIAELIIESTHKSTAGNLHEYTVRVSSTFRHAHDSHSSFFCIHLFRYQS